MAITKLPKIEIHIAVLILSHFFCLSLSVAQDLQKDSLLNELSIALEDTTKVNTLNALSALVSRSEPTEAIGYGNEAKELAKKLNHQQGLGYAFKNIGLGYFMQSNYVEALVNWEESLNIFESLNDQASMANLLGNIGSAFTYMGDDANAIDYHLRSLKIAEETKDSLRIATCLLNIGGIYTYIPQNSDKALPFYERGLDICRKINYRDGIMLCLYNLGEYYFGKEKYDSALIHFEKSLDFTENTIDIAPTLNNIGKIYAIKGDIPSAIRYQKEALQIAQEMDGKLELAQIYLGLANTYQEQRNVKFAIDHFEKAKKIAEEIESNYELKDAFEGLSGIYATLSDYQNAYKFQMLLRETEKVIYNSETDDKIKGLQFSYEIDKKQDEIEDLTREQKLKDLEIQQQRFLTYAAGFTGFLLILLFGGLFNRFKFIRKTNRIIEREKERSDELLLNILPEETAEELKERGSAKARSYDMVTILFTDFKGFTELSSRLSPQDLVKEIHHCYKAFDEIMVKYKVEKIKTIGDAYMAAGGLPVSNETHPFDVTKAAIEIIAFMNALRDERQVLGKPYFDIRIGIHTGPVVAGVVGTHKFAYDIWGDTVNIASRMESNSEPGKINVSEITYDLIKDAFECTPRGKIAVKGAGEKTMYFVDKALKMQPA